jgi:hypothetical protein
MLVGSVDAVRGSTPMDTQQMSEYEELPTIPGGVATVAVFALAIGLWLWLGHGATPGSGPLRAAGIVIVVAALAVLCEALGLVSLAATPW